MFQYILNSEHSKIRKREMNEKSNIRWDLTYGGRWVSVGKILLRKA